eukprot:826363-Ditylum_brightwellii.AAC.1
MCDADFPTLSPTVTPTLPPTVSVDELEENCSNIDFGGGGARSVQSVGACVDLCVGHSCCFFGECECHFEATCERFAGPCIAVIEEVFIFEESKLYDPDFSAQSPSPSPTLDE